MRAQLSTLMSQVGSNLLFSQLHPLRPSDQSQGSKLSQFLWNPEGRKTDGRKKSTVEVGDPTGTPPKNLLALPVNKIVCNLQKYDIKYILYQYNVDLKFVLVCYFPWKIPLVLMKKVLHAFNFHTYMRVNMQQKWELPSKKGHCMKQLGRSIYGLLQANHVLQIGVMDSRHHFVMF